MFFSSLPSLAKDHPIRLLRKLAKFPKQYVNLKAVRGTVDEKRQAMQIAESRLIESSVTAQRFRASKLTVYRFLCLSGIDEERSKDLEKYFSSISDLLGASDPQELYRVHGISGSEVQRILRYSEKLKAGVWPSDPARNTRSKSEEKKPPKKPLWSPKEDCVLTAAVEKIDAGFGDPWIFVASEIPGKTPDECMRRYFQLKTLPELKTKAAELRLVDCMKPLFMNRDFRLIPPRLVVVPDESVLPAPRERPAGPDATVWKAFLK